MPLPNRSNWSKLKAIALPFYKASDARRHAWGGLIILATLLLGISGMNIVNSYMGRDFMTALAERHSAQFFTFAAILAGVFAISTVVEVFSRYTEQWLGVVWREWLTRRLLDRYLSNHAYLRLADQHEVDNPDERMSLDVQTFTATMLSILIMLTNGIITLVAFSWILWSITPWLFLVAFGYAAIGLIGTTLLGWRLIGLNHTQIQREADFRYGLGRLREHAEAVAQVEGEEQQKTGLFAQLSSLVQNFLEVIRVGRNLGFFIGAFNYMPQIIPAIVVAPLYIRGTVEFGAVTQAAMAFAQVQGVFSIIEAQYQQLTTFAAVVGRLGELWDATEPSLAAPAEAGPLPRAPRRKIRRKAATRSAAAMASSAVAAAQPVGPVVESSPDTRSIVFDGVSLWLPPERQSLVRELSLEAPEGKRVAIVGPHEGCNAMLLATAGLWADGEGRIGRPSPGDVMFVPHRPCTVTGRLRDILTAGFGRDVADAEIQTALKNVGLDTVVAREGGLDKEQNWTKVFSASELQALTFARLLLANPRFAFVEDPSKNIEPSQADRLYRALARSQITYLTTGCPEELLHYHDLQLHLYADGTWQVEPAA